MRPPTKFESTVSVNLPFSNTQVDFSTNLLTSSTTVRSRNIFLVEGIEYRHSPISLFLVEDLCFKYVYRTLNAPLCELTTNVGYHCGSKSSFRNCFYIQAAVAHSCIHSA